VFGRSIRGSKARWKCAWRKRPSRGSQRSCTASRRLEARGDPISFPTKILVTTDGSEEAGLAASTAADIAGRTGSELHVVHVGKVAPVYHPERHGYLTRYDKLQEEAQRLLDEQVEQIRAAGGTVAQAHLRMGLPDKEIVVLSEEMGAGLIVAGSRGLGTLKRALLGSVSSSIASGTPTVPFWWCAERSDGKDSNTDESRSPLRRRQSMTDHEGARTVGPVIQNLDKVLDAHTHLSGSESGENSENILDCMDACGVEKAFIFESRPGTRGRRPRAGGGSHDRGG
jgi:nucleotide-binding universal stress UspA family protein